MRIRTLGREVSRPSQCISVWEGMLKNLECWRDKLPSFHSGELWEMLLWKMFLINYSSHHVCTSHAKDVDFPITELNNLFFLLNTCLAHSGRRCYGVYEPRRIDWVCGFLGGNSHNLIFHNRRCCNDVWMQVFSTLRLLPLLPQSLYYCLFDVNVPLLWLCHPRTLYLRACFINTVYS